MRFLVVVFLLFPISLFSQSRERFDFRGMRLGDSVTREVERTQRLSCRRNLENVRGLEWCTPSNREFAGGNAIIIVNLLDRKISSFLFSFDSELFYPAASGLQSRWGEPDSLRSEVVENRMGAKFENVLMRWILNDGVLELDRYGTTVTEGALSISNASLDSVAMSRRLCEKAKKEQRNFGGKLPEGCV